MTVTASLRTSLSSKARGRPLVAAHASSGARYGSSRFQSANDKRRQTASNYRTNGPCGPMMTPMGPFFGMDMMNALLDPCGPLQQQSANLKGKARSSFGDRRMLVDIAETDSAYEIAADLPGLTKDSIKVDVDGDALTLAVQKPAASSSADSSAAADSSTSTAAASAADTETLQQQQGSSKGGRTMRRRERGTAFADRTLRMPDTADMEAVSAEYEAGVLTVTVQKKAEAVAQRRQVPVA